MGVLQDNKVLAVATATSVLVGYLTWRHFRKRYLYWNSEFQLVGSVKEVFLYPIKSGKSLNITSVQCTRKGVQSGENKDRQFLVVDAKRDHLFLTARQYPKLVLIESHVDNGVLTVTVPGSPSLRIVLTDVEKRHDVRRAILHAKKTQDGLDCGDEVGKLIAEYLEVADKRDIRLLHWVEGLDTERDYTTSSNFWLNEVPIHPDSPNYQDLASYMLCTEASTVELNERLAELGDDKCTVSVRNFRPNFNVEGTLPFDEDRWLDVKIGEVEFACFKPCTRCVLTTVDPAAGAFLKNMQPLRKLREYRLAPEGRLRDLYEDSPIFGVNMLLRKPGEIKVGDKVFVRYKPSPF